MAGARYLKDTLRFKRYLSEAVLWMFVISGVQLWLPKFMQVMLDDYIPNKKLHEAFYFFLAMVGAFLVRGLLIIRRNNRMLHFGYGYIYDLRMRLMRHFQLLSARYFDKTPLGDIITRMLDDIMNVEYMTTNALIHFVTDGIVVIGVIVMLVYMDWKLAVAALLIMPLYVITYRRFRKRLREGNREIQRNYATLSSEFSESITGIRLIKSFSLERFKEQRLQQFFTEDMRMRIKTYTLNAIFNVSEEFLTVFGTILVLFYGGYLVMRNQITVGQVVAFYTYVGYLYNPLLQLVAQVQIVQKGLASVERVFEVLDTKPWPPESPNALDCVAPKGDIEFRNVTFHYDGGVNPSLVNVSFQAKPGETVALVGASGAGKSTVFNLALRFYDPAEGAVLVDGRDIREFKLDSLRHQMAIVLQEGFIFSGTIADNIKIGRLDATPAEVEAAARDSQSSSFIASFPEGLQTRIGEGGVKLSGGQKQLIAIARAILRNVPFVLLDEPTSAMDTETQHYVQKSLQNLFQNRTTLVIAHRLATIQKADLILVMKDGKIVERGKHDELIALGGYYSRLFELQFAEA